MDEPSLTLRVCGCGKKRWDDPVVLLAPSLTRKTSFSEPCHLQIWIEVIDHKSFMVSSRGGNYPWFWWPFCRSDGFKVNASCSRFSWRRKKRPDYFSLSCPGMLRKQAFVKHHLEQPGLAAWLSQATRSKAKHRMQDLAKFSGRGLGDKVFWEALTVSGIEMSWRGWWKQDFSWQMQMWPAGVLPTGRIQRRSLERHPSYPHILP